MSSAKDRMSGGRPRDLADVAMAARCYRDAVNDVEGAARRALLELAADLGARKLELEVRNGGVVFGTVSLIQGKVTVKVTDQAKLLAWVQQRYPTEVVSVPQVRPAFLDRLLAGCRDEVQPVDTKTGEIIPGVMVEVGDPTLMVRPTGEAREAAAALVRDGRPLELPGSNTPVDATRAEVEHTGGTERGIRPDVTDES